MIKFFFDDQDFSRSFVVQIVDVDANGEVRRVAKPMELEWTKEYEDVRGVRCKPTLEIYSNAHRQDISQAIQDGLDEFNMYRGKRRTTDMLQGELNSTKYHLEDMRALAGLEKEKK